MGVPRWGRDWLDAKSCWLCPLDSQRLCAQARLKTGLADYGEPTIEPALSTLVESLNRDAELHPLGRFLIRVHIRSILETRLRLAEFWKAKEKGLRAGPISRPVFIVGMPRSGSTFLHELLAEDPGHRAPRVWEVMFPVPERQDGDQCRRMRKADACLWWFRRLAPKADAVYPMRATTPHECVAIQSYTLLSQEFVSTCRVSTYEKFLGSADLSPVYEWQKRFLQHLQTSDESTHWVLKSPDHVHGLAELFKVFPDACIIHTHRNPLEVLKSSAELTWVLHGLFGWRGSRQEIGERETRILAVGTEKAIRFRDEHPELAERFIDVKYTDLAANPLGVVQEIYRRLERPLTLEAESRMRALASRRSRYQGRRQALQPSTAGREGAAGAIFRRYCTRFNLSWGDGV